MNSEKSIDIMLSQSVGQFFELKNSVSCLLNCKIVAFTNLDGGHILTKQVTPQVWKMLEEGK